MSAKRVLTSLSHAGGDAGVYADDEGSWLTSDLGTGGTGLRDFRPAVEGFADGTVEGGLAPPGAVSAVVIDAAGDKHRVEVSNGAWVVVLTDPTDGEPAPVGFLDASGQFVAPSLPADWSRSAVDDAVDACPVCGRCEWDAVVPTDDSRGMVGCTPRDPELGLTFDATPPNFEEIDWQPSPFAACRICGHEGAKGTLMRAVAREEGPTAEELEAFRRLEAEHLASARAAMATVAFPVYAPAGRAVHLGGWSGGMGHATSAVTVSADIGDDRIPGISVESSLDEDFFEDAVSALRDALESQVYDYGTADEELSETAALLRFDARDREAKRIAHAAAIERRVLAVDGADREFLFGEVDGRWAALRREGQLQITITSRSEDPGSVRLERMANLDGLDPPPWGG
jgi:hypothetical protein